MNSKFPGELESLEWDPPLVSIPPLLPRQAIVSRDAPGASLSPKPPLPGIRDLYIAARFPGLARCGGDLEKVALVIEGARLYFDECKTDRALELLDLAIEQCPSDEPFRLARLEIAFLLRDAALYTALAEEFRRVHGASSAWLEITRLGRTCRTGSRPPGTSPRTSWRSTEGSAADRDLLETTAGDDIFTFRFNRVRERGRGWVMAGFEVAAARRRSGP